MRTWFTSDTHFFHANIIDYCDRPFGGVRHMNQEMIQRWNSVVQPDDTVYHLGDFAMGQKELWAEVAAQLNGRKILVRGNHDRSPEFMLGIGIVEVHKNIVREVDGVRVWMNHYPLASDDARDMRRLGAPEPYDLACCGHIHEKWRACGGCVNVGVDVWNFSPITLEQLVSTLRQSSDPEEVQAVADAHRLH